MHRNSYVFFVFCFFYKYLHFPVSVIMLQIDFVMYSLIHFSDEFVALNRTTAEYCMNKNFYELFFEYL